MMVLPAWWLEFHAWAASEPVFMQVAIGILLALGVVMAIVLILGLVGLLLAASS